MQVLKVLCALDTGDLDTALDITRRLSPYVGGFKIGHALTLPHGLSVIDRLTEVGAKRIFLDLKFHDIPNTVALAVREAAKYGVWMMTLHTTGGPAMMEAAVAESRAYGDDVAPLLVGVNVLTSLDQHILTNHIGVNRTIEEQMKELTKEALDCGLDGIVCPATQLKALRPVVGYEGLIVTPGIRLPSGATHDQSQIGTADQALNDGADYLVIGRTLIESECPEKTLEELGFSIANR